MSSICNENLVLNFKSHSKILTDPRERPKKAVKRIIMGTSNNLLLDKPINTNFE